MLLHCEFEAFNTIFKNEDVIVLRKNAAALIENVTKSGKFVTGGMFPDTRGFFLLLNAESAEEIYDLIAPWANDHTRMRIRPVMELEKFPALMQKISTRYVK